MKKNKKLRLSEKQLSIPVTIVEEPRKAYELMVDHSIPMPWQIARFLNAKEIRIYGDSAGLTKDGDIGSKEELRSLISWLADQFGGRIKWDN